MTTFLYTHPACLAHDPGRHHPESPARLQAVLAALDDPEFTRLERCEAPEAAREDLLRVHPRRHVEGILGAVPKIGHLGIDADTVLSPASGEAVGTARNAPLPTLPDFDLRPKPSKPAVAALRQSGDPRVGTAR